MQTITLKIAQAAAKDEADRQMKANGRNAWNEDDFNLACRIIARLLPDEVPHSESTA